MTRKILLIHNRYQEPGGEDAVFAAEGAMLRQRGHEVVEHIEDNHRINEMSRPSVAVDTIWSRSSHRKISELLHQERPDIVHCHNTFPLVSPAAYYAARAHRVPIVQTLHNYRLLCPNALFSRDGRVCEDCMGKFIPWPGIRHACYRRSRSQTLATAAMLATHRLAGSWTRMVDAFIALTEFSRRKFIQGGLPADRISVKPNFVLPDPGPGEHRGGYALFVGRLSSEKGIETLIRAWERLSIQIPLRIVGDGPLASYVAQAAGRHSGIDWLGRRPASDVYDLMGDARAVIVSSELYETFGRVVIEAYAKATPVIGANIGAIAELIEHGRTGLLFSPGDATSLATEVEWAWAHHDKVAAMGRHARSKFEAKYTAEHNYEMLMEIYDQATARAQRATRLQ